MKIMKVLVPLSIAAAMTVCGAAAIAQQGGTTRAPSAAIGGQGEEGNSLEIAPQPGLQQPRPGVQEIPGGKTYEPGEDTTSNLADRPELENDLRNQPHRRPYLGVRVQYASQCYLGKEEQGLLVTEVDPGSPAEQAGVHSQPRTNGLRATAATAAAILGPLGLVADKLLEQPGGDLIVAVDDKRVRSQMDLDDAIAKLRPGDTMYLTVIRPLDTHGNHRTLKIKVQVGSWNEPLAKAGAPPMASGPTDFTH
jgi:PDZ domain